MLLQSGLVTKLYLSACFLSALCGATGTAWAQQIFRRGDTDASGTIDITDPINNLSFQFLGTLAPPCRDAADFDDNGLLDITDPINNLSFQFLGTEPPVAPGEATCGPDPTADQLTCESYPAQCEAVTSPLLSVSPTELAFTDEETVDLRLGNVGEGKLEWTVATSARWISKDGKVVVEAPIGSSVDDSGIAAGEQLALGLKSSPSGLPVGMNEGKLVISTNGGSLAVPTTIEVTQINLTGLWVGSYLREGALLPTPGIAVQIEQEGDSITAAIDGRLAPALATSIRKQANDISFEPAEGSVAQGVLDVANVPTDATVETWTLTATDASSFSVEGNRSGGAGTATVGTELTTTNGMTLLVSAPSNGRVYQAGDRFEFRVGSYGFADGELTGNLAAGVTGAFVLDPDLSGVRANVTRSVTFSNFEIVEPNVLDADLEMRHTGLLTARDVVTSGRVRLAKRQGEGR